MILDSASHDKGQHLITYARTVGLPLVLFEVPSEQLEAPALSNLRRSDHSSFWATGYPRMMLTDTAEFRKASPRAGPAPSRSAVR